jgi:hypothetical protein
VKTENPSACVTVNCKTCRTAIALYFLYSRVVNIYTVNKYNSANPNPVYKSRTTPTRDRLLPPQGLPPYRGEQVCAPNDPESYASGSVSFW